MRPTHINIIDVAFSVIWEERVTPGESAGPVHEIEVKVVSFKIFQRQIAGLFNILRMVIVVPQLSDEEDVFSRHTTLLDALCNRWLCPISRPLYQRNLP